MSSVLVTGGMGVIGSWVTRQLVEQGTKVVTYQRSRQTLLLKDIMDKFEAVPGDVLDLPRLIETMKKYQVDRVIHMAGLVTAPLEANPFLGYKINVDGAMNVFEACRLTDVKRVVAISTKGVYDKIQGGYAHPTYRPVDEDYPKAPTRVYGATKLFIEHMSLSYNRIYGLDVIALRFASTNGPGKQTRGAAVGDRSATAHALHSQIIESAMLGRPLRIPQGADQFDDMVYHRDIASGIVRACFADKTEHRIFNIGTGKKESLVHLVEILNKIFGKVPIEIGPGLAGPGSTPCILSIDRARRELGYAPQYDLEAGVRDYIDTMKRLDIKPVVL